MAAIFLGNEEAENLGKERNKGEAKKEVNEMARDREDACQHQSGTSPAARLNFCPCI